MATRIEVPALGCTLALLLGSAEVLAEPPAGKADKGGKVAPAATDKGGNAAPAAAADKGGKPAPAADRGVPGKGAADRGGKPAPADKGAAGAPAAGAERGRAAPGAAATAEKKKAGVPLAPTREELDRLRAQQKQEPEMGAGYGSKKLLRRPFPTSTGNTAGPSASQGAGTSQDRKAATLDAGGPTQGVRR